MTSPTKASSAGPTSGQSSRLGTIRRGALATRASSLSLEGSSAPSPRHARLLIALTLATAALLVLTAAPAQAVLKFPTIGQIAGPSPGSSFSQLDSESVAVNDSNSHILVADSGSGLVYDFTSASDTSPTTWDGSTTPAGSFGGGRVAVAVDNTTGDVYVADATHAVIDKFTSAGNLITAFGDTTPTPNGQLAGAATPASSFLPAERGTFGIAVNQASHNLYVIDSGNQVIDVFDSSGAYMSQISDPTAVSAGLYGCSGRYADGIAVGPSSGHVFVSDSCQLKTYEFDSTGTFLSAWNGNDSPLDPGSHTPDGSFGGLYTSVAVDGTSGDVFIIDTDHSVTDAFDSAGNYLAQIAGVPGASGSFGGISVGQSTGDVYVSDNASSSVKIFGPAVIVPDVTTNAATSVQKHAATLNGHLDPAGGGNVTDCHFDYVDESSFQDSGFSGAQTAPCAEGNSFSAPADVHADLTGLSAGTTYHYRLDATDAQGANTGTDQPFTTTPAVLLNITPAAPVSGTTATLNGHLDPAGGGNITDCHFDYVDDSSFQFSGFSAAQSAPCTLAAPISAPSDVSADISGLSGDTTYHFRLVATNSDGTSRTSSDLPFTTLPTPVIDAAAAQNLTPTDADLTAAVNPNGFDTTYHFEWGTADCSSNPCTPVPVPDGDLGSGTADVAVATHLTGLSPDTTYHWRVIATNANGTVGANVDHTFIYDTSGAGGLPADRAYEQVTPPQKNGAAIGNTFLGLLPDLSDTGQRLVVTSIQCFADAVSCPASRGQVGTSFSFDRTSAGWQTTALAPPATQFDSNTAWALSATVGTALFSAPTPPDGEDDFYARQPDGTFTHIGPLSPPADGPTSVGNSTILQNFGLVATADLSHIAWRFERRWPFDATLGNQRDSLYEYVGTANSQPLLVGVSGGPGSTDLISACGTGLPDYPGAMSADGRTLYFNAEACPSGSGANASTPIPARALHARIDGELPTAHTVTISERSPLDCTTPACTGSPSSAAEFQGASADGSKAYFLSTQQLTDDASQDPRPQDDAQGSDCTQTSGANGCNLYLYDFSRPAGHRLLAASAGDTSGNGPGVQGLMGVSTDGSHVYFLANGVLAPGAAPGDCHTDGGERVGHCNLYVYDAATDQTAFIAALPSLRDSVQWTGSFSFANVTPDGRFLVFTSHAQLTPDDTSGAGAGQLFRYDAATGQLIRLSIGERGFNDNGNSLAAACDPHEQVCPPDATIVAGQILNRVGVARHNPTMSDDGSRVFFMSPLALTPRALDRVLTGAINGSGSPTYAQNVYQWEQAGAGSCPASHTEGCVSLISDGRDTTAVKQTTCALQGIGASSVCLIGTDATGDNVFFTTADRLVPQDTDSQVDFYDARVGGGFPFTPPPPSCQGDACRGAGTSAPPATGTGSAVFSGPGNPSPHRRHHKKRHHRRHHRGSHKRANSNRGGQK